MKKIPPLVLLVAFFLQLIPPAFGVEILDGRKVAVVVTVENNGMIRYNNGKYWFYLKKNDTEPEVVKIWKEYGDLKSHFNIVDGTATDKGMDGTRPITKSEETAWKQEWEKLKKLVWVIDVGSNIDFSAERGRIYEYVDRASTGNGTESVYVLRYTIKDGGGTVTFPVNTFKYRPPWDKKFELGVESGLYVPILTGTNGKKFIPLD